jgi:hypothetical protein
LKEFIPEMTIPAGGINAHIEQDGADELGPDRIRCWIRCDPQQIRIPVIVSPFLIMRDSQKYLALVSARIREYLESGDTNIQDIDCARLDSEAA